MALNTIPILPLGFIIIIMEAIHLTTTTKPLAILVIVHEAKVVNQILTRKAKPWVRSSINRDDRILHHFQTPIDETGEDNPKWNCLGELVVLSTDSTVKTDDLVLELCHHRSTGRIKLIGLATLPLELLMAGDGIGRRMSLPLIRSNEKIGRIIISHEIREVRDLIPADEVGEPSNGTPQDGPPRGPRLRFRVPSFLSMLADCFSVFESAAEIEELISLI